MKKLLIAVAATFLLAAGSAGAAPAPDYSIDCVVGGNTTVTWSRAKLDQATLRWFTAGAATSYASVTVPIKAHPPKGFITSSAGTGIGGNVPERVVVSFRHADGSGSDDRQGNCAPA